METPDYCQTENILDFLRLKAYALSQQRKPDFIMTLYFIMTLLFILPLLATPFDASARSARSWVEELDPASARLDVKQGSVLAFWQNAQDSDADYNSLMNAASKNRKLYREASWNVSYFLRESVGSRSRNNMESYFWKRYCNSLETELRLDSISFFFPDFGGNLRIAINSSENVNAAAYPDGYISVCHGLISRMTHEETIAVCCHELAHYMMQHSLLEEYRFLKRRRSNTIIASIGVGLMIAIEAFAAAYSNSNDAYSNDSYNSYKRQQSTENYAYILEKAYESEGFKFRYSRREELQADILGLRYMQLLGYSGQEYLSMLNKLDSSAQTKRRSKKRDTHPSNILRREIIEMILTSDNADSEL